MFHRAIRGQTRPNYLSTDNDPLYRFPQWQANLRVLEVTEIKTVLYVPLSHPFVERLVGTVCRECLDRTFFWTATDLEGKLLDFQHYYNEHRTHAGRQGHPPGGASSRVGGMPPGDASDEDQDHLLPRREAQRYVSERQIRLSRVLFSASPGAAAPGSHAILRI